MPDEHTLTLLQADQARSDFVAIESELEVIQAQLARLPTRGELAGAAFSIIFCTAVVTTLFVWSGLALGAKHLINPPDNQAFTFRVLEVEVVGWLSG